MPSHHCCVVGCHSDSRVAYKHGEKISFFKLPNKNKKTELYQQWVVKLHRENYVPSNNTTVCEKHFVEGKPTSQYPVPCLNMGYKTPVYKARRQLIRLDNTIESETPRKRIRVGVTSEEGKYIIYEHYMVWTSFFSVVSVMVV